MRRELRDNGDYYICSSNAAPQCDCNVRGDYQLVVTFQRIGSEYQSDNNLLDLKR